ncbi:hypothetical protein [Vreelandella vilamensis]|uniref:hypothetical protein n=1 Tax=Vreelandella vilamensis TaxID=531309 RepID=UPI00286B61CA|nr:hypothetical protein [Halomonas vilamensis]
MIEDIATWLDMPLSNWVECALTLALGAFLQRATGFGLVVIGAPQLLMIEPFLVPVVLVLFVFTLS